MAAKQARNVIKIQKYNLEKLTQYESMAFN